MNRTTTLQEEIDIWIYFWGTALIIFVVIWVLTQIDFKNKRKRP